MQMFIHLVLLKCGILNNPSNGGISATGSIVGSTATYFCNGGYELVGSTFRVCQPNGQWSDSEPSCQSEFMDTLISAFIF